MKKTIIYIVIAIVIACFAREGFAGYTQTDGEGVRPISMGGAFIAVADGAEAVFYNPAGLTQIKRPEVSVGQKFIFPMAKYTDEATLTEERSDKFAVIPNAFSAIPLTDSLSLGLGMYAPFAKTADYETKDPGFGDLTASTVRIDYSPVLAYKVNESLSIGAGAIISDGKTKQQLQTVYGSGAYMIDDIDGWGASWLVGALYNVNKELKVGGVYRGRMSMKQQGQRQLAGWSGPRVGEANINFPATTGMGIAYSPTDKLTAAFDVNWNMWSFVYDVDVKISGMPDMIIIVDAHDTVDYRLGFEVKPDNTTSMRCGFAYIPSAVPSEYITPQKPDFEKLYAVTFGASKTWKKLELGLLYEYTWSNKWKVFDNTYGYNGYYEVDAHIVGVDVKYRF